jgi:fumarate reductase subunit D
MAKSNKPIVWSLFAGGGLFAAFVVPAMIFVTGIAVPLGLLSADALAYDRILALAQNPFGKLALFLTVFLPLWHAAHRLRMTLHDLGVLVSVPGRRAAAYGCYGLAALGTLVAAVALLSL